MIRTRIRKILRDVWARKGRTALVSLAIFIGVAGTIALFSMSDILVRQLKEDIKEDELPMGQVALASDIGAQRDDPAYLELLNDYPGVTEVQAGMSQISFFFRTEADESSFEEGFMDAYVVADDEGTRLIDVPFEADAPIQPFRLLEGGAWPQPGQNELAVERRMADEYGLAVGDPLYVRILSPSRDPEQAGSTGTVEEWTITGIAFHPYSFAPDASAFAYLDDANYITGRNGISDLFVRFTTYDVAQDEFDEWQGVIASETPYTPAFSISEDPAENTLITNAELITNLMGFLALIALVVSGFLVVNVVTSIVTEQRRQIGVMKSLGATRGDNFFIYTGIAFVYGVIAVIPGVLIGVPGGDIAAKALAPEVNTILEGFQVSPFSIFLGVLVGLLVPVLASLLPVFNGTRVRILEAMTDLGISASYGSGPVARFIKLLPVPITIRQGLSNVSMKTGRLAFTVLTLAIAVGAFMGIYALFSSLTRGIDLFIDSFNVQIAVFPNAANDPDVYKNVLTSNFPDDIAFIEEGMQVQVEFEGYDPEPSPAGPPGIFAYGYNVGSDNPAFNFEIDEGEPLTEETRDTGIIFSSLLAANMGVDLGDTVVLRTPGGSDEFTIVGISEFPLDQVWIDWRALARVANYTFDQISGGSPIADMIPDELGSFIKYASAVEVEGVEPESAMLPGTFALGLTPNIVQYLMFEDGDFVTVGPDAPTANQVMVSSTLAAEQGYTVGDTITVGSLLDDGSTADYTIVGIFSPSPLLTGGGGGEDGPGLPANHLGFFWRDLTALDGATVTSEPRPGGFFILTPLADPTADEIAEIADRMNDTLAATGNPSFLLNFVELTDEISTGFVTIQAILSAVAGLIALVGALGLLTTLSMSVFERQKEIGVMRSIGAGSTTVALQFLTEGVVVGLIAWLVGLPMMVLIHFALLEVTGFGETFPFEFSLTAILIGLIGMLVVTVISSLWPSLSAARKTVSDILRYQ